MEFMRKAAAGWVAKVFIAMLVASFAIWGINDIFRGYGSNDVVTVGDTTISAEAFQRILNLEMTFAGRDAGHQIGMEEARQLGIPGRVVGRVITEATLDEAARRMSLGVTDKEVARQIAEDPNFKGPTGGFDRNFFRQLLRQNGYSEDVYIEEQRATALRRQIASGLAGGFRAPEAMLELYYRYENETRTVDYVILTAANAGDIAEPDDTVLGTYYESRKAAFRAPEYRKFSYMTLEPQNIAKPGEVTDAEARQRYDSQQGKFSTPERRQVLQLLFKDKAEAEAAVAEIAAGKTFDDLLAARNLKDADVDLGLVVREKLIDPAVAEAAFGLAENTPSGVVEGRFGPVVVLVRKIEPASVQAFEEVAAGIKADIALSRAEAEVLDLHDAIEDARASGSTFAEIAEKFSLPLVTVEAVSRNGDRPDGTAIDDLPEKDALVNNVFESDKGVENDPIQVGATGFLWYDVVDVTPARDRELAEVRDKIAAAWRDDEVRRRLREKGTDWVKKIEAGTTLADLAAEAGLTVAVSEPFTRLETKAPLTANAADAAFGGPKGLAATTTGENGVDEIVMVVASAGLQAFFKESAVNKRVGEQLDRLFADGLLEQYVGGLQTRYGVHLNERLLTQIVGTGR